ncbi:MAG: T9SS type A sorting domain-containing protein [Bacteroidia bacterium]
MILNKPLFPYLLFIFYLLNPVAIIAQAFHFQNTSATIIKNTSQSPAHWYIQIYNDVAVDTTLRWKADVSGVPAAWNITFDDQNNFHNNVQTGDSADFTLFDSLSFPQKLIIGAWTNNVAATGSVFIDVYDPANPSYKVTLEYIFIISPFVGIPYIEADPENLKVEETKISFSFKESTSFRITSQTGQLIYSDKIKNGSYDFSYLQPGVYVIYFFDDKKQYVKKFIR